jgi:hypothetical protein
VEGWLVAVRAEMVLNAEPAELEVAVASRVEVAAAAQVYEARVAEAGL